MISPEGPTDARIVLVGEAAGETEEKLGLPFKGLAGKVLDGILTEVGLPRAQCYITNVMLERPAGNNFAHFYEKLKGKKVPTSKLLEGYARLENELTSIHPNVIVAMGNEAMKAVLGFTGVEAWRGSVLPSRFGKVIPTIHPASVLRQWSYRPAVINDFERVLINSRYPEIKQTPRELVVCYDTAQAINELNKLQEAEYVTFDIETETDQITCIGFSADPQRAICIPFWFGAARKFRGENEEAHVLGAVQRLLEGRGKKIAHNGAYDVAYIKRCWGFNVSNFVFDSMLGFHTLYPELPKGLDYLTSIYTDQAYYKFNRVTDDADVHFRYNATDACITYECAMAVMAELKEGNLEQFYQQYVHNLIWPLMAMEEKGVRFDTEKRNELRAQYRKDIDALNKQFESEVGHEINPASPAQVAKWLYEELHLPVVEKRRKDTGEKTVTVDEETLGRIFTKQRIPAIETLLRIRESNKIYSTYLGVKLDEDHRIRCSYLITGTETGRLSSRTTSRGTGTNLQNVPAGSVRALFLPDEGQTFVNADLSQAEARVVAYLSGEERLIAVFNNGGDIHRKNAANIFHKPESEVTDEERQLAKRVIHASNYGMGPVTFSQTAGIPVDQAKRLLNQYFATYPRIKQWHLAMSSRLQQKRVLVTPFGRRRIFFNRWDESTLKEGLAFLPQSVVADIVNQALIELHEDKEKGFDLLLQVHDSILVQTPGEKVTQTIERMKKAMIRPLEINGKIMVIPVDFKVGSNWNDLKKVTMDNVLEATQPDWYKQIKKV